MNSTHLSHRLQRRGGFTLVELLVALALGLVLTLAVSSVYLFSKGAFLRQDQLSGLQQGVRTAFEYLAGDARMVGHLGCFTGKGVADGLPPGVLDTNYQLGIEGYEYKTTANFDIASDNPSDTTQTNNWEINTAAGAVGTIPLTAKFSTTGLTPGSDVLVIRTVAGAPQRLTAAVAASDAALTVRSVGGGTCTSGSPKVSGLCDNSHALIASCTAAKLFQVGTAASSGALTVAGGAAVGASFPAATAEVFPMQTIAYYVKQGEAGTAPSLWRRIFNGETGAGGVEQELIEGVESMQVLYGSDTTATPDGVIDGGYQTAQSVGDWNRVVAVRVSLLLRSSTPIASDLSVRASATVGDVAISFPNGAGDRRFDRRVFTTTIAVRNKISYL
jgi:type IV pilus assembly protein PilW